MSSIIKINLKPFSPTIPGRAQLVIQQWQFAKEKLRFSIQRNQDQFYLGDKGIWSPSVVYHEIETLNENAETHFVDITENLLDPLLKLSGTSFRLQLEDSQSNQAYGVLILEEGLLASSALGNTPINQHSASVTINSQTPDHTTPEKIENKEDLDELVVDVLPLPEAEIPIVVNEAPIKAPQTPKNVQPAKKRGVFLKIMMFLLLILLLISMAFGALYFLKGPDFFRDIFSKVENKMNEFVPQNLQEEEAKSEPEIEKQNQRESEFKPELKPETEIDQENLNNACVIKEDTADNQLAFVKSCLQSSPSGADLMKIITNAKTKKLCQVAQRIYAYKSQSGDKLMSLAYAKEFDSAFNDKDGCFAEDKETAIYWYEKVLSIDPMHAQALERVKALKP